MRYVDFNRHSDGYRPAVDMVRDAMIAGLAKAGFKDINEHRDDTVLCVAFDAIEELLNRMGEIESGEGK